MRSILLACILFLIQFKEVKAYEGGDDLSEIKVYIYDSNKFAFNLGPMNSVYQYI